MALVLEENRVHYSLAIIIKIIFALKGANRDFLQSPLCAANRLQHARLSGPGAITCNISSAYHVQHVVLHATWYEGTAQLLSLTEIKSHLFELYFVELNHLLIKEGRKPEYPEKATSFRKCNILKPEDSSPKRDSSPSNSTGGRLYNTAHLKTVQWLPSLGVYGVCPRRTDHDDTGRKPCLQ